LDLVRYFQSTEQHTAVWWTSPAIPNGVHKG